MVWIRYVGGDRGGGCCRRCLRRGTRFSSKNRVYVLRPCEPQSAIPFNQAVVSGGSCFDVPSSRRDTVSGIWPFFKQYLSRIVYLRPIYLPAVETE